MGMLISLDAYILNLLLIVEIIYKHEYMWVKTS
jgi:hypothetical protein